jgi:predicted MPP superfamily phosphohydrolase
MNGRYLGWRFNLSSIEITNINLCLPGLPAPFQGFRILQISDFHLGTSLSKGNLEQIIQKVNSLNPDLVAITGDFVNHDAEKYAPEIAEALKGLTPGKQKLAVLGNHDHWTDAQAVRWALHECDVTELRNSAAEAHRNGSTLFLAGIDDHLSGYDDLAGTLAQLPEGISAILLAHEPDFAEISAPTRRFSLQLSGHSHGGQINLPIIGAPYLPPLGRKYPGGLYSLDGMKLYTNRGLGTSWLGLRINCPPEITVFNLSACLP